jgi:ribosome biogenesis GTPase
VETAEGLIVAQIPGRLKKEWLETDIATVGDWVTISLNEDGTGTIEEVAERRTALARARPSAAKRTIDADREQVLVANVDQVV